MLIYLFLAYAPTLFMLWYVYHKDKIEPEPKLYVIITFIFSSTVSPGVSAVVEYFLLSHSLFVAPFVEEFAKFLAILIPYKRGQMDGIMDGVVYGVSAGLGFSAFENLVYGLSFGKEIAIVRAILTPIAHSAFTSLSGVGLGLKAEGKTKSVFPYLLVASLLHLAWNLSAIQGYFLPLLITFNILLIYIFIRLGMREDVEKVEYYLMRKF